MSKPSNAPITCPACGTLSPAGRFCIECGGVVREASCAGCSATLARGARFCHRCGAPAGADANSLPVESATAGKKASRKSVPSADRSPTGQPRSTPSRSVLPLAIGGIAFVAVAVIFAAQRASTSVEAAGPAAGGAATTTGGVLDISQMSPRERAARLFDRVMRYESEGKKDSIAFFASIAVGAYEALGPFDTDLRYDFGRIQQASGNLDLAQAHADTILRQSSTHLLGLLLAARVAEGRGDLKRRDALEQRMLAAEQAEFAKTLEEYALHRSELTAAIETARSRKR